MYRLLLVFLLALLVSCSTDTDYKNRSRATGWKMIGGKGVFSKNYKGKVNVQETGPGLVFIEGGTFTMGRVQDDQWAIGIIHPLNIT